jgi:hypothetical protein
MHGREEAAEGSIAEIEGDVAKPIGELPPIPKDREIEIRPTQQIGYVALLRSLFKHYAGYGSRGPRRLASAPAATPVPRSRRQPWLPDRVDGASTRLPPGRWNIDPVGTRPGPGCPGRMRPMGLEV